jgi:hypothetical protein
MEVTRKVRNKKFQEEENGRVRETSDKKQGIRKNCACFLPLLARLIL